MPKQSISYNVLIASPSDTAAERDVISDCIRDWNSVHALSGLHCSDLRWELDSVPAVGERSQAILNQQLVDRADILIGVFKARVGSSTGVSYSGTIEEIERCDKAGKLMMLYFSTGPVPREHSPEQLQLVKNYQRQIAGRSIYGEFFDPEDLRRKVSRHLASTMANLQREGNVIEASAENSNLARVHIRSRVGERSGDVKTVKVAAIIENLSAIRKIKHYDCTLSVPAACLTHSSGPILGEVQRSVDAVRRSVRRSNSDGGAVQIIFQGDNAPIIALNLGVDQLSMTGTRLAGDYQGTLADSVTVDAVIEGEAFHAERTVGDIFANPNQG